ncbi:hypothetical protein L7F22_025774 [Adiantum nelumboides]|nr:hypothetical protein [Adiantum nelumboides]
MLSSVYKILVKLISSRLRPFLLDLIHTSQTGFVQDRCISDNFFCLRQAINWARTSSMPLAIVLLDFEKAYDRVDWDFLEGSLDRMGFPLAWIRGVSALYMPASSSVTIGGHAGRAFQLSRSMRQGMSIGIILISIRGEVYEEEVVLLVLSASFFGWPSIDGQPGASSIGLVSECVHISVDSLGSDVWKLERAIQLLKEGAVGVIPTDTVYAIVCDLKEPTSIDRIYSYGLPSCDHGIKARFSLSEKQTRGTSRVEMKACRIGLPFFLQETQKNQDSLRRRQELGSQ